MQSARKVLVIGGAFFVCMALAACSREEEKKRAEPSSPHGQGVKKETFVVVPTAIKGQWKAVKIGVTDKNTGKESLYEIAIGTQAAIPGTPLAIRVDNFLPHFIMEGTTLTSQSNDLKNPAAQVKVFEDGKEIFKGWLFALYPTTHAFQHPRYGFSLKDFVPAK